ncbi:MAG TPA: response regulator [Chthoniobacterales bacterium]|nr:response regulator [Chthoniobacterales bacterium]
MNETTSPHTSSSSAPGGRVLVLAPDEQLATAIQAALQEAAPAAEVAVARSLEEAQQLVLSLRPDLFVLDVDATYDLGQEFLYDLRTSHPQARAIVLTAVHLAAHREQAAGLGAIHFLEKPFPHGDFVDLVGALLHPGDEAGGEKFQGTLSDLHIADIIQLKCMSGATSVLEFTGPGGEKARVFFENGQVRHATAPGKEGMEAFNEIVNWKGGMISEVSGDRQSPRSIDLDWQILLMEAVRKIDETRGAAAAQSAEAAAASAPAARRVLVIDDSVMLLNFVREILTEANYDVAAVPTAEEGLRAAATQKPHLILLDYVLPDMKGDEVLRRLLADAATASLPVVYMSGFGADLPSDPNQSSNVIGSLNKPFTSELLLKTVETYMPNETGELPTKPAEIEQPVEQGWASVDAEPAPEPLREDDQSFTDAIAAEPSAGVGFETEQPAPNENAALEAAAGGTSEAWWDAPPAPQPWAEVPSETPATELAPPFEQYAAPAETSPVEIPIDTSGAYFCGDTSFFSMNWALQTIAAQKLTGTLRAFWSREPVELLARGGRILLATTRDPELYCSEAPITLVNIDEARTALARQQQRETGRPLFITLAQEGLILREPAVQLVQHYGQKLFAQLWTAKPVRFMFEQGEHLPSYADELPSEEDVDYWALSTLRFIQFTELGALADYDPASIPAYTRDGFERVQHLRLTVAEAQFASQFNGVRSIAQIAKNLRLDLKFARLTLFRFLVLEIVECWPPAAVGAKQDKRGVFGRMFGD